MKFILAFAALVLSPLGYAAQNAPLLLCYEQRAVGTATEAPLRRLTVFEADAGGIQATLSVESLEGTQVLVKMTCDYNDASALPGGIIGCYDTDWLSRWYASFLTAREPGGDSRIVAVLSYEEVEVLRLRCVDRRP